MIGKLKGRVDTIHNDTLILDVNGVGYLVACSAHTLRRLPETNEVASLLIETKISEDRFDLYGFLEETERAWYRELIKVNGVSSKIALAVLSVLAPGQLSSALAAQDKVAFKQVSGVGPKLAMRLVTELKDKIPTFDSSAALPSSQNSVPAAEHQGDQRVSDALSALVNLGYSRSDAYGVVNSAIIEQPDMNVSDLIRHGLKALSRELT